MHRMRNRKEALVSMTLTLCTVLVACSGPTQPASSGVATSGAGPSQPIKTLTIGLSATVGSLGALASPSGAGGWLPMLELVTDASSRPTSTADSRLAG